MFRKFASNILKEVSDECVLKSFSCRNEEDREIYKNIANRIDWLVRRIGVEEALKSVNKEHD